jgi:hydrogenase expression/formation protein HypE
MTTATDALTDTPTASTPPVASPVKKNYTRPLDIKHGRIDMGHGAGGKAAAQLIEELFVGALDNPFLRQGDDGAALPLPAFDPAAGRLVMATDGHVISPLFFPGGDIGCLAVHGTVNDVAMMGATPLYLSASFIIEEGFPLADLQRIVQSMGNAAREAGVPVVTGDTKVVEKGKGDGVFISTTGVGVLPAGMSISGRNAQVGDVVLLSGTIGDHGVAVLSQRESLAFETTIQSDTAALHTLVADLLAAAPGAVPDAVHVLRDPTRGGLATTLNEIARQSGVGMRLQEAAIPVKPQVDAACELLGLDPLYVANEGKLVAIVSPDAADALLAALRAHSLGGDAARIGVVTADPHHFVQMDTRFGGRRVVDWLSGEQLPRIC